MALVEILAAVGFSLVRTCWFFALFAQHPVDESVAICTQALHVAESRFVTILHFANVRFRMVDLDAGLSMLCAVLGDGIKVAALACKFSVEPTVLCFLCRR